MTIEEAIQRIVDHMRHHGIGEYPHLYICEALEMAIDALRAKQEAEKNEPLTLDELRQMIGSPVWVTLHDGTGGRWGIVSESHVGLCASIGIHSAYFFEGEGCARAYKGKPKEAK